MKVYPVFLTDPEAEPNRPVPPRQKNKHNDNDKENHVEGISTWRGMAFEWCDFYFKTNAHTHTHTRYYIAPQNTHIDLASRRNAVLILILTGDRKLGDTSFRASSVRTRIISAYIIILRIRKRGTVLCERTIATFDHDGIK